MLSICEQTSMSATATTAAATHTHTQQISRAQQEEPTQTSAQQVFEHRRQRAL